VSVDAAKFRTDFPELSDTAAYPESVITFWLGVGVNLLPADRWDTLLDIGLELFTAHHVVIASREASGTPGAMTGPHSAEAVDKVSYSMDTQAVTLTDGGFWNMTSYGIQFLQLARMIGSGGIQVGACP
jgi:hypothetical protein